MDESPVEVHPHKKEIGALRVRVVTVSDTRTPGDDASGDHVEEVLRGLGHSVRRSFSKDEEGGIRSAVERGLMDDAVITTGGTGISSRDVTIEALRPLFDKELTGFSAVFAIESYGDVGTRAVLSRATAGIVEGVPVFCLPGSLGGVETGMEILKEELGHVVDHAR